MRVVSIKSVSSGKYLDGRDPGNHLPCLSSSQRDPALDPYLRWIIEEAGANGEVSIKSFSSSQYLDGRSEGTPEVLISPGHRTPPTDVFLRWVIIDLVNGKKAIKSVSSNQYLDGRRPFMNEAVLVSGGRTPETHDSLCWEIEDANIRKHPATRIVAIKSVSSGQYLDGHLPERNDPVLASNDRNPATDYQLRWILRDLGNGHNSFLSVSSDQYLDGGLSPETAHPRLTSAERDPTNDRMLQWTITDVGNGKVSIRSVSSDKYLDGRSAELKQYYDDVFRPYLSSSERIPESDDFLCWTIYDAFPVTVNVASTSAVQGIIEDENGENWCCVEN